MPGRIIKGVHTLALVLSEGRSTQDFPARDRRAARSGSDLAVSWLFLSRGSGWRPPRPARRLGPGCFLAVPQPWIGLATAAPSRRLGPRGFFTFREKESGSAGPVVR